MDVGAINADVPCNSVEEVGVIDESASPVLPEDSALESADIEGALVLKGLGVLR